MNIYIKKIINLLSTDLLNVLLRKVLCKWKQHFYDNHLYLIRQLMISAVKYGQIYVVCSMNINQRGMAMINIQ